MVKDKKGKSKIVKRIIAIVIGVPLLALLAVLLFNLPKILYFGRNMWMSIDTGHKMVDTTLTMDQKLSDLDYMYEIVCLENPQKELFEQAYGISYDEIHERYREYVKTSKSDYEYFSYLACFLAILPGEHNAMSLPDYSRISGFNLSEISATQKMKNYQYSWKENFRDDVEEYRQYSLIGFRYVDGKYYNVTADSIYFNFVSDYKDGQLLTFDGKDPKDLCFDFLERSSPAYDKGNDCYFRDTLWFNNGIGTEHTIELLMPDGNIITTTVYESPAYDMPWADSPRTYPELMPDAGSSDETDAVPDDAPQTYRIAKDPERKLVYLESLSCNEGEAARLVEDLTNALAEVDADTVIIDIRSNKGGTTGYCSTVLSAIFSHDYHYSGDVIGCKNSHTKRYYNDLFYRYFCDTTIKFSGDCFTYTENFDVTGNAPKDYKIYLLTSQESFSSADLMARMCKDYDNAVLIGTNTKGEGICGTSFHCYLPESRFEFLYTPTVNTIYPEDSFNGTDPDIYIPYTAEEYFIRQDLKAQGTDATAYEVRLKWDKTLQYVIGLVDGETN